jgi:peptidylprolyl isomerase
MLKTKKVYDAKYKGRENKIAFFATLKPKLLKHQLDCNTQSLKSGGKKPANGANVFIHYAGFLEDGII